MTENTPLHRDRAPDLDFMLALANIAIGAGAQIMKHFGNATQELKADQSPVTIADREAEAFISQQLRIVAPEIQIIGEEACSVALPETLNRQFFLVDPLDGTKEFLNNRPDFTVNIGLIDNAHPIAGVIFAPARGSLYLSGADSAYSAQITAFAPVQKADLRAIHMRDTDPDALIVVASRSHLSPETHDYLDQLAVAETINAGSSLKFCLLAEGLADLYPRHGRTMEWDTAAGHAILNSAGGVVHGLDGQPLTYGKLDAGLANPYFIASARQSPQNTG